MRTPRQSRPPGLALGVLRAKLVDECSGNDQGDNNDRKERRSPRAELMSHTEYSTAMKVRWTAKKVGFTSCFYAPIARGRVARLRSTRVNRSQDR